jgi:hypothetical protein
MRTRAIFGDDLQALAAGRLHLANLNLDTGKPSVAGDYPLADQTAAELARRLAAQAAHR